MGRKRVAAFAVVAASLFAASELAFASEGGGNGHTLVSSIGVSIFAATVLAFAGNFIKQPLLLAYIVAGVLIGPKMGFGLITSETDIQVISEIGLILLLFMIGLEIDFKKLRESGRSLILSGVLQFLICVALGAGFFFLFKETLGLGAGKYDLHYLAVCTAISSTAIVVKLLYEKFELDTLPGRLTLGVLVFQDIWAIVVLGVQPNLANPEILAILWSFAKGGVLVLIAVLITKYFLGRLFRNIAKLPELVLVASLGWCFFVCGLASVFGLSVEMGALIAGAVISTFPYNLDVIAKIVSIRDFFITLFFVALGMQIPSPLHNPSIIWVAAVVSLFLILSRYLALFPLLYGLRNGNRVSLLVPTNLAQISEFALVIAALGKSYGHISDHALSVVIFVFAMTSISSTYMIKFSHQIQGTVGRFLQRLGVKDISDLPPEEEQEEEKDVALLGFFRVASSLVREMQNAEPVLKDDIVVVDFNPVVHEKLTAMGIKVVYGDISHMDTLHHAGIHNAKVVISSIPDTILKGTDNLRLIRQVQRICPQAKIIVTAESASRALKMYAEGADYVFLPRVVSAQFLMPVIKKLLNGEGGELRKAEVEKLQSREEIIS